MKPPGLPSVTDKFGWPWSEETQPLPPSTLDGIPWPKISIVTPSFNQGQFIEETIRSVLLQNYPNLEYIIVDGGSSDSSVEIIKKYEPWLTYWVSEPDRGQGHAINKGFSLATGEIGGWLNSDDIYFPGALRTIASWWLRNGKPSDLISGSKLKGNSTLDSFSRLQQSPITLDHLLEGCIIEQPSTFFPLEMFKEIGGIDERYHLSIDYDLWLRFTRRGASLKIIDADIAVTRIHPSTKTSQFQRRSCQESILSVWRNYKVVPDAWLKKWVATIINPQKSKSSRFHRAHVYMRNMLYRIISTATKFILSAYRFCEKLLRVFKLSLSK